MWVQSGINIIEECKIKMTSNTIIIQRKQLPRAGDSRHIRVLQNKMKAILRCRMNAGASATVALIPDEDFGSTQAKIMCSRENGDVKANNNEMTEDDRKKFIVRISSEIMKMADGESLKEKVTQTKINNRKVAKASNRR